MSQANRWTIHSLVILVLVIAPALARAQTNALQWDQLCSAAVQKGDWHGVVDSCSHEEVIIAGAMQDSGTPQAEKEQLGEILVVAEVRLVAGYAGVGDSQAARQQVALARQTLQLTTVLGLDTASPKYKELQGRIDAVARAVGP
ncbi:MAG TPA: hypothetical protein VMT95_11735 [Candidatus Binatia bacterium]|nr:hypothetical protein [Candidatus Binatia bacterium]